MRSSRVNCSLTTEFALVQENILLQNERITKLYVVQSEQNPYLWFGVLFVDDGLYKNSVIRFTIFIEETYPDCTCPKIVLDPVPPHPLVNPSTGELDTKNAFPEWNSNKNRLFELLLFIKRVIYRASDYVEQIDDLLTNCDDKTLKNIEKTSDNESTLSQQKESQNHSDTNCPSRKIEDKLLDVEAHNKQHDDSQSITHNPKDLFTWFHHTLGFYAVYNNDQDKFRQLLSDFRDRCSQQLLDRPAISGDDKNAIVFSPWNSEMHEPLRKCVLAGRFTPTSLFATYHKQTDSVAFIPGHEDNDDC